MEKLDTSGVKILKIFHLIFSMMWVVGVMAMAVISLQKAQSGDELYMILRISRVIDDTLVIPGAVSTVITAIVYGVFTNWGFFKHKWMIVKWVLSLLIIIAGTFYFSPLLDNSLEIANTTRDAALNNPEVLRGSRISALGALVQGGLLIFAIVISVEKPWKAKRK
ncbi:hypothetical protein [Dysgonomonas sp. 521]|uniref:hypothetical protein n=1 Tax=Dysgonomonas sp. 521 TaxID=2302932 RepID=UPI0013D8835E|nr:hypothetical protein [Dysgonomonas sp. 521]